VLIPAHAGLLLQERRPRRNALHVVIPAKAGIQVSRTYLKIGKVRPAHRLHTVNEAAGAWDAPYENRNTVF
jgi:hypothetical protein